MKTKIAFLNFFLFLTGLSIAQTDFEIIKIMNYNLLNYRNSTTYCTETNNPTSLKDSSLKTMVQYAKPDIITCNEIGSNFVNADRLLTNSLNTDGVSRFEQAQFSNNTFFNFHI